MLGKALLGQGQGGGVGYGQPPPAPVGTLTGATWATDGSGRGYNTPTLTGSELISNGEFTTDTTSWITTGNVLMTRRDFASSPNIAPTGGSDDYGVEVQFVSANNAIRQEASTTAGRWYSLTARHYSPSSNSLPTIGRLTMVGHITSDCFSLLADQWTQLTATSRAIASTTSMRPRLNSAGATSGDKVYYDAISAKQLTLATLFATVDGGDSDLTVSAELYGNPNGVQAGVVANLDDAATPANFIIGYLGGSGNARLEKCVGGTYTSLISVSVTFAANARIEIRRPSGNTFQLWYNGVQVGTDQTISDAGVVSNTIYGAFSTHAGNTFHRFLLDGAEYGFPRWIAPNWTRDESQAWGTPAEPANEFTDPDFNDAGAWTIGTGWTVSSGNATTSPIANSPLTEAIATVGRFYRLVGDFALSGGTGLVSSTAGMPNAVNPTGGAFEFSGRALSTDIGVQGVGSFNGSVDFLYAYEYTLTSVLAYVRASATKIAVSLPASGGSHHSILIGWLDDPADPQNYILVIVHGQSTTPCRLTVIKCVAGAFTTVLTATTITAALDAKVELRKTGTTFQAWYNGSQVGSDLTISDAGILGNECHGIISLSSLKKYGDFEIDSSVVAYDFA